MIIFYMKHNYKVIAIVLGLFLLAQVVGLYVANDYYSVEDLPLGLERPELDESSSFVFLFVFVLVATILVLLLLKFKLWRLWKIWFFFALFYCLTLSFSVFVGLVFAFIFALSLAVWRVFFPNPYVHNFTEVFIYGALAAVFAPILSLFSVIVLLLLISIYDYIAVFKTKHMVKMAKSQSEVKVFAGLMVPYGKNVAILGGGDVGFPLLFSAVVMWKYGFSYSLAFIPICVALALFGLFYYGDNKKFYPAMPFVMVGCLVGLALMLVFNSFFYPF